MYTFTFKYLQPFMTIKARQKEYERILKVAKNYIATKESSILYIYGVPGSGKTYTVTKAFSSFDFAYINCNNMHSKSKIYSKIMQSLKCNTSKSPYTLLSLVEHLKSCNKPHIIVLDEMDLLKTKTQSILYNIYSLPYYEKSSVLLITMSNSFNLDLDEKIISRIGNNKIMFQTYKSDQLMEILGKNDKITEYLSRRVAAMSGDARKAISLYKRCKGKSVEETEKIIRKKDNNFLLEFINSLTKFNKLFLLGYYNEEKVNDAFENFNAQLQMKEMEELEYLVSGFAIEEKTEEAIFNIHKGAEPFYSCEEKKKTVIYVNGKYMKIEGKSIFGHRTVEKIMKSSKVVFVKRFDDAKIVNENYASYKVNLRPEIKIYVYKMVGGEQLKGSIILCQMEHVNLIKELILAHFKNYISHADNDKHVCLFEILKKIC